MTEPNKISFSLKSFSMFFILLSVSLILCFFVNNGFVFSMDTGMLVLGVCFCVCIGFAFRYRHFPFLLGFFLVLYLMPFLHFIEYAIDSSIINNSLVFGLHPCLYAQDEPVMQKTLLLAIIGLLGFCLGILLMRSLGANGDSKASAKSKTFTLPVFIFITFLSLFLSYIFAPQLSLFKSNYAHGINILLFKKINFNGSWQLSYGFLILLLIDVWSDSNKKRRWIKYLIFFANFFAIVLWLQFMRGDRECFGVIVAVAVLFLLNFKVSKMKIIACGVLFVVFVFVLQYLGAARSQIHRLGRLPTLKECKFNVATGPWSGALRSPLSVAGDFYYGAMVPAGGKTMLSLILSTIPGPAARAFGIERPVEGTHGPAWEMRYGIGGTHCVVVPYMDFGFFGVLFFLALYGFIFAFIESLMDSPSVSKKLLYGCMFTCLPFFIWYGELSLIRGIMAWMIIYCFYLALPKSKLANTLKN